jgi:hypothetical protein
MRSTLWAVCAGFGLLGPSIAHACPVCDSGDPLVQAGESTPRAGQLRLRLEGDALGSDMRMDEDMTMSLAQETLRPDAIYSPRDALNVVVQLPVVRKDVTMHMMDGDERHVSSGLGDLDVGARWFPWSRTSLGAARAQNLALTVGSSLPTGGDEAAMDGMRLMDHAQVGSGAFGPYVGVLYALQQGEVTLSTSATLRAHTMNGHGYRYGGGAYFGASAEDRVIERLSLGLGLDGRWAASDTAAGERQENTGGFLLALTPLAVFSVTHALALQFRAQVPIAHQLHGDQRIGPVFTAGLEYAVF